MEQYIGFVIVLFLLSMICERFSDFWKHSLHEENTLLARIIRRGLFIGDTLDKGRPNSEKEEARYFRILKINITCGFLIAAVLHADLFSIFYHIEEPFEALTWEEYSLEGLDIVRGEEEKQNILSFLLGCLGTGLFISFGSKFWHDLLDLLLQVKNLRRKLTDPRTYEEPESIEQVTEFIHTPESRLAHLAVEQHGDAIAGIEGVISVGPGYMEGKKGKFGCIEVHLEDEGPMSKIPDSFDIKLSSGRPVSVPVHKIVTGVAELQSSICGAGMLVSNKSKVNGWGSAGAIVKKKGGNDLFLLSCYHVLSGNKDLSVSTKGQAVLFRQGDDEYELGVVEEGRRSEKMDAAIARITNIDFVFTNDIILNPKEIRKVTSYDVHADTVVRVYGGKSGLERTGVVHHDCWKEPFKYDDAPRFEIEDLLVLTRRIGGRYQSLTVNGDSGSLVMDSQNKAIGLIVGGNAAFTYAIKMTAIEKYLNIDLV